MCAMIVKRGPDSLKQFPRPLFLLYREKVAELLPFIHSQLPFIYSKSEGKEFIQFQSAM